MKARHTTYDLATMLAVFVSSAALFGCGRDAGGLPEEDGWSIDDLDPDADTLEGDPDADRPDVDAPDDGPRAPVLCPNVAGTVVAPGVARGVLPAGRGGREEVSCAGSAWGVEGRWELIVEEPMDVAIYTTFEENDFSPVLTLHGGCDQLSDERACSSPLGQNPYGYSGYIHRHLEPGRYMLVVDERTGLRWGEGGRYTVHVERAPLLDAASCDGAITLEPGVEVASPEETLVGLTNAVAGCFASGYDMLYYALEVPARHTARVAARYTGGMASQPPFIKAADACDAEACVSPSGSPGEVLISNPNDEAATHWVAVSNNRGLRYAVRAEVQPMQPNTTCADAAFVAPGQVVTGQDLARGSVPEPVCEGDARPKLFYTSSVPPGHRLWADAEGVNVTAKASCGGACFDDALVNESDTPQDAILEVSRFGPPASFDMALEAVPLADNRSCQSPTVIRPGDTLRDLDARGALNAPFFDGCGLIESNFPLYFMLEVPLAEQARVVVQPHDPGRATFSVQAIEATRALEDTCTDHACVESFSYYFNAGATEAPIVVSNQGQDPRRVLVVVTNDSPGSDPWFDLVVERVR